MMTTDAEAKAGDESSVSFGFPWWHGMSNTAVAPISAMQEPINSFSLVHHNVLQNSVATFYTDIAQEQQTLRQVVPSPIGTSSSFQMASIGNSMVLPSHQFQDPIYGGFTTCSEQINPGQYGMQQSSRMAVPLRMESRMAMPLGMERRLALPLGMEEEPVYVNAKQYHGIIRRREMRAKAEMEKKAVKNRKPYLHESRHNHALRRARGAGGRFLNTKELNVNKEYSEEAVNVEAVNVNSKYDGHPCDTTLSSQYSGNDWWMEQASKGLMISEQHNEGFQSNGGRDVHGHSSTYNSQSSGSNDGQGRGGMKMNGFVSVK